jgi:outer membrane protein assembly factor BamE (lipoprotein component of BamABCDE complex)
VYTMKLKLLSPLTLLFVLLTGCFGPTPAPDQATTFTASDIESSDNSLKIENNSSLPTEGSTDRLSVEPFAPDMQEILTTHARIREILNDLLQSEQELSTELQEEFTTLLDQSGPFVTSTQLQHFKESLIGVLTTYKLYFYEDCLASLQLGSYVKSDQRIHYEAYLKDLGGIDEEKLKVNDELIHRIAAKLPIPYNEEQGIVIDQAILEVLIANQMKTNLRIDHIFENYTSITMKANSPEAVIPSISTVFTLGSTAEEVKALMGTPEWIQNYKYVDDEWQYGESYVRFDADFKVNGFNNKGKNLKIQLNNRIPGAEAITKGSTTQQVAEAIGTPDAVLNYNSAGSSWSYGQSRVDFDKEGIVKGWINSADFNLFNK